ncbi:MAG: hypothetical protein ABI678_06490 [Kofleriaceae bacterium]
MTNRTLSIAMFAAAGLTLPALAEAGNPRVPQTVKVIASSPTNFAPITNPDTTNKVPGRLRRSDEQQPGNEMAHLAMFGDGIHGLFFSMSTDLVDPAAPTVSHKPTDRIQLAMVPFALVQNTDGSITTKADYTGLGANTDVTGGTRFVTKNNGSEYRNANHPIAYAIADGAAICAEYNYQPNNNTERYMECFNTSGATVMAQTKIYAKNNDDCSMNQDKSSTWVIGTKAGTVANHKTTRFVAWRGCNGNGQDDGWAQGAELDSTLDTNGLVTKVTFKQTSDVSLCPREERSHGYCTTGTNPDVATCTWTEGNTQPQRDGTWMAAIDLTKNGNAQLMWKMQIDGKKQLQGVGTTYSMRAMHDRVMKLDPATKKLVPTDDIIVRVGDLRGNNNGNNKGGAYYGDNVGVYHIDGATHAAVVPLQDMSSKLLGMDGTHLGMTFGLFGTTDNPQPGLTFISGSHTGGGYGAQMRVLTYDSAAQTFGDGGMFSAAPYDRHLYPNYLGNNPGNQGRNYSGVEYVKNPFATGAANEDAYLMVFATTGKPSDEVPSAECLDCAKRKLAAFISVVPVLETPASASGTGSGSGTGGGTGGGNGGTDPSTDDGSTNGSTDLGGCSTAGGAGGATSFLLIGFAAFIRRRRA